MAIISDEEAKRRLETSPLKQVKEAKDFKEVYTYVPTLIRENSETKD